MTNFDPITSVEITNTNGVTIKLGDIVKSKGSKIERRVMGITPERNELRGVRLDGVSVHNSTWLGVDNLTVVC